MQAPPFSDFKGRVTITSVFSQIHVIFSLIRVWLVYLVTSGAACLHGIASEGFL